MPHFSTKAFFAMSFGRDGDVLDSALELPARHHHDRSLVAADQARDVLAVGHRRAEHQRVAFREFGDQVESVGDFATVLVNT